MIELIVSAVTLKVLLACLAVVLVLKLFLKRQNRCSTNTVHSDEIPGPECSDEKLGREHALATAGSLPQLLEMLHAKYGPIVKFNLGPQLLVSLANVELFDQITRLFNRPYQVFEQFEPLITRQSIQFANDEDGLARRNAYDRHFSHAKMKDYEDVIVQEGEDLCREWQDILITEGDNARFCLQDWCLMLSFRSVARCCFGAHFKNPEVVKEFRRAYDETWNLMEETAATGVPLNDAHPQIERFRVARDRLYDMARRIIQDRRSDKSSQPLVFVDYLMDYWKDNEDLQLLDTLVFLIGGFHTTGFALVHALYFLAANPEVQEKLRTEVAEQMKSGEEEKFLSWKSILRLTYLRACIDETMRVTQMSPYAARISDKPLHLTSTSASGKSHFTIPPNTPVLLAMGVSSMDPAVFPEPQQFRPERFQCAAADAHKSAFETFGVGRRKCPGYRFAYLELSLWLVQIISQFRVTLSNPPITMEKIYGLLVKPKHDLFVHLQLLKSD